MDNKAWKKLNCFVDINSPWLRLIGEKLETETGQVLDYWRVEKADSVVIVTIKKDQFLLPMPTYRPGVGKLTLDFPGGRVPPEKKPAQIIPEILQRELGIEKNAIASLLPLNSRGWEINSSFSNQKLYGFVAEIYDGAEYDKKKLGAKYPNTKEGIRQLLDHLSCLQCRCVLLEYFNNY